MRTFWIWFWFYVLAIVASFGNLVFAIIDRDLTSAMVWYLAARMFAECGEKECEK
jgi:hypothetical protein